MRQRCLVCGGKYELSRIKGLIKCDACGFLTTDMDLSAMEIKKLYSADYFHGEEYADYLSDKKIIQKNFIKRIKRIGRVLTDMNEKSLLEVGCAYGFFLETAKGFFKDTEGIDISDDAVQYARDQLGQNAHAGDFALFESYRKYDVICMWDTIEHLQNPDLYIEQAGKLLKKGGHICITTGDVGSLNARVRGKKWRQIHPPTHLHYFSKNTLSLLLRKKGFRVVDISYPANTLSVNTIMYILFCLKTNHQKLYRLCQKLGLTKLNINVNLHDFMFIIAEKI